MDNNKQGKDDDFLEELIQFLHEEEEKDENKIDDDQMASVADPIVPNRAEINAEGTTNGTNIGPGLPADLPNDFLSNEGAQHQTRASATTHVTIDHCTNKDDDMEVTLTRVSKSQSPGTAQNPGQCSTSAINTNDRHACTNQQINSTDDRQPSLINSKSVEVVTPSQTAQTADDQCARTKSAGPRISGRTAYKGQPPPEGPGGAQ